MKYAARALASARWPPPRSLTIAVACAELGVVAVRDDDVGVERQPRAVGGQAVRALDLGAQAGVAQKARHEVVPDLLAEVVAEALDQHVAGLAAHALGGLAEVRVGDLVQVLVHEPGEQVPHRAAQDRRRERRRWPVPATQWLARNPRNAVPELTSAG